MTASNTHTHYTDIPAEMANVLIPPRLYAMATAVVEARQNNKGDVKLTYEDGSTETARVDFDIQECESFFEVVEAVQGQRQA